MDGSRCALDGDSLRCCRSCDHSRGGMYAFLDTSWLISSLVCCLVVVLVVEVKVGEVFGVVLRFDFRPEREILGNIYTSPELF